MNANQYTPLSQFPTQPELQHTLLQTMSEGVFIACEGHFVFANEAMSQMLGYAHAHFLGQPFAEIVATEYLGQWKYLMQHGTVRRDGSHPPVRLRLQKQDPTEEVWVELQVSLMPFQGRPSALGVVRDITQRRRAEQRSSLRDHVLEQLARGAGLESVMHAIVFATEEVVANMCCAVLLLDPCAQVLRRTAVPNLPQPLAQALDGLDLAQAQRHGLATRVDQVSVCSDLSRPGASACAYLALQAGLNALWSAPVRDASGHVCGVFVAYFNLPRAPIKADTELLEQAVLLAGMAVERKQSEELIWRQANFDMLTLLPNRNMFHDRLTQQVQLAAAQKGTLALLAVDLDRFQKINEDHGSHQGDLVLIEAAARMRQGMGVAHTVARLGSNEFVVILADVDSAQVDSLVLRLMGLLSAPYMLESGPEVITASLGLAWYPDDACNGDVLLSHTSSALQVAKSRGGNQCCHFTSDLLHAAQAKARLVRDMRQAIDEQQFMLFFQPIVDVRTGQIHKAEALLRWQHPELGMVSPADFIPLAEETGMIVEIGNWVFEEAACWAKRWRESVPDFQVSINKSPAQFDPTGHGTRAWLDFLRKLELPGEAIVIEITEGLLLHSEPHVAQTMAAYRAAGIQLAIDDFGTGYSALSYLKKFHIDYLKIDQSFVRNLAADASDLALCEAIVVMAHRMGLNVVAEGLETQAQHQLLSDMGCDLAQGYLFAKAMAAQAFEQVLAANAAALPLAAC